MTDFNWDLLGVDEGGLPIHLPISLTRYGQGPTEPDPAHHYECWCRDVDCPLTLALQHAWLAGRRVESGEYDRETEPRPDPCTKVNFKGAHGPHYWRYGQDHVEQRLCPGYDEDGNPRTLDGPPNVTFPFTVVELGKKAP